MKTVTFKILETDIKVNACKYTDSHLNLMESDRLGYIKWVNEIQSLFFLTLWARHMMSV